MFEHKRQSLLPRLKYYKRIVNYAILSISTITLSLLLGVFGYHFIAGQPWIDALVNASMILGGMGPVDPLTSDAAKWFASLYALFSGMILLVAVSILIAPIFHRFLHHFHLDMEEKEDK